MKPREVVPGGVYTDGKGRFRLILDPVDSDVVEYAEARWQRGSYVMTPGTPSRCSRAAFARWALVEADPSRREAFEKVLGAQLAPQGAEGVA